MTQFCRVVVFEGGKCDKREFLRIFAEDRLRLGIATVKRFAFHVALRSPCAIFAEDRLRLGKKGGRFAKRPYSQSAADIMKNIIL